MDFGTALAGETVRLRFRVGTDGIVGSPGWTIDDIVVNGIDNLPFSGVAANVRTCQLPPSADAGPDVAVRGGVRVTLSAAASDPNGDALAFVWTQTAGPAVTLSDRTAVRPTFTVPAVATPEELTFELRVTDVAGASASDRVTVRVTPAPAQPEPSSDGGCSVSRRGSDSGAGFASALLGLALFLARR